MHRGPEYKGLTPLEPGPALPSLGVSVPAHMTRFGRCDEVQGHTSIIRRVGRCERTSVETLGGFFFPRRGGG